MALISKVGRKHPKVMLGIAAMYILLIGGAVTMVYPFMMTLTAAMSNDVDYWRYSPYPVYWFDEGECYLKYLAAKYADPSRFDHFRAAYRVPEHWGEFRHLTFERDVFRHFPVYGMEKRPGGKERLERIGGDYWRFIEQCSKTRRNTERLMPLFLEYNLPDYRDFIQDRYEKLYLSIEEKKTGVRPSLSSRQLERNSLDLMATIRGDSYESYFTMDFYSAKNYAYELHKWLPSQTPRHADFVDWVMQLPAGHKMPVTRHYLWTKFLADERWDVDKYEKVTGKKLTTLLAVPYPKGNDLPEELAAAREQFLKRSWPLRLVTLKGDHRAGFARLLRERHTNIAAFNEFAGTRYQDWSEVPYCDRQPCPLEETPAHEIEAKPIDALGALWRDYADTVSLEQRELIVPEVEYQRFLLHRYGSLDAINEAYGWSHASLEEIELPIPEADYYHYLQNARPYFWKFVTFGFGQVIQYMATKGRAFFNTVVLVGLTVLATLTINPMAAYALSRFRLRGTNNILIFLLATMAFPAEVAMIPSFLLLRDLGLLNTFGALILPGIANGFSIFLLKGFFDSLPQELYDAAAIDGASEMRIFTSITLRLCKPILAVIALNSFIAAYSGFMWAFLVCQDPKMWTLMVWLYQFQQQMAGYPHMTMASLVLSSIPTLIVFLFCQKIILRGIIIPTMK